MKIITDEDIHDFIFEALVRGGYSPSEEEMNVLCDIFFDYLIHLGIMDEM